VGTGAQRIGPRTAQLLTGRCEAPPEAGSRCACGIAKQRHTHRRMRGAGTFPLPRGNWEQGSQVVTTKMRKTRWSGAVACLLFALYACGKVSAQAPPGPLPGSQPQEGPVASQPAKTASHTADLPRTKNLAGSWKLNTDESDDPRQKLHGATSSGSTSGGGRSPGGVGGWPGMGGHGGYGGYGGGRGMGGGESDEDRQKMQLFVEPAQKLTIVQKEPEIDINDDSDRKFAAFTDGRKTEKSKDPGNQQFDAKWDGYRLVMEGKDPRGNKYERSYEVLEGNQQLRETLSFKVGRNNTPVSIRYVYDLASKPQS